MLHRTITLHTINTCKSNYLWCYITCVVLLCFKTHQNQTKHLCYFTVKIWVFFSQKQTNKTKKKSYFVILLATKVVSLLLVQFCRCMTLAACRTYIYLVFSFLLLFHCLQHDNLLNVINRYNGYYSWIGNKWHKKKRQEKSGKVLFRECSKHAIWADRSLKNTIFIHTLAKENYPVVFL